MSAALLASAGAIALVLLAAARLRPGPTRRSAGARQPAGAPRVWRRRRRARAAPLADYLAAVARHLRAGGTVTAAFLAVTPDHPAAAPLLPAWQRVADGLPLVDALRDGRGATSRDAAAGLDVTTHVLACAASIGGSAAASIDAAAVVLRERDAVAADARSHSAQARLSGQVLTIVPLAFAAWSAATDERIRRAYVDTSIGALCIAVGLLLNLTGWWWIKRIVAGSER